LFMLATQGHTLSNKLGGGDGVPPKIETLYSL
jgi:hypothetical protein